MDAAVRVWIRTCLTNFHITIIGVFMAAVSTGVAYFSVMFLELCHTSQWQEIYPKYELVRLYSNCIKDFIIQISLPFALCLITKFPLSEMRVLISNNVIASCFIVIYNLVSHISHFYGSHKLFKTPLYVCFAIMLFHTTWIVASRIDCRRKGILKICVVLFAQYITVILFGCINFYVLTPIYLNLSPLFKFLTASFIPLIGYVCTIICNIIIGSNADFVETDRVFTLTTSLSVVCVLLYRTYQTYIDNLQKYFLLSLIHAVISFLERILSQHMQSVVHCFLKKLKWRRRRCLAMANRWKINRTNLIIVSMIVEIWAITVANAFIMFYAFQKRIPFRDGKEFQFGDHVMDFAKKVSFSILLEFILNTMVILYLKSFFGMSIPNIWSRHWRFFTVIILLNTFVCTLYHAPSFALTTAASFKIHMTQVGNVGLANILTYCNSSYPPY
ncbi:uncharacterized protein LOC130636767 [Hydractinia symbiolongicarpus]|uniref:uncharacterized protein LOC130636767 n=1 Tax=Hydractinia symbiolongicarpus TaxID=13093 RepID=UPI00254BC82B|nr:uncharacterized protein LOC130636767 [Hydractinia symbiolongicarpus]